jgi:hypothetical protein
MDPNARGRLSAWDRHFAALGAARLHLCADDRSPRPDCVRAAVAAWEEAQACLAAGGSPLQQVELQRIGAAAMRKLARLKTGVSRVAALERAIRSVEHALRGLNGVETSSGVRVALLRERGEMLAALAGLGAGAAALERSIASFRRALEEAAGIDRADALEGLAQVLTDLAASRGEGPPAAAHDALEEAYGLLVVNGAPQRADTVLTNSRRLGPRPDNDPT